MHVSTSQRGAVTLAQFHTPSIDAANASAIAGELTVVARGSRAMLIDLSNLEYLDCFGFEALLAGARDCSGIVRYVGAPSSIDALFLLAHLQCLVWRQVSIEDAARELASILAGCP